MKNYFGTDGIRGTIGTPPFDSTTLTWVGNALGQWITQKYGPNTRILIGHDTRESCNWAIHALMVHLSRYPLSVDNGGTLPTPAVCNLIHTLRYDLGIIISASHNKFDDNGIKLIDRQTGKINKQDEQNISDYIKSKVAPSYEQFGQYNNPIGLSEKYITNVVSHFEPHFLAHKKVILDCAHGATSTIAPAIFKAVGATVVAINNQPTGQNINKACGTLALSDLKQTILNHKADIGFAFDGDGDRVITVNNKGSVKDGDDTLALLQLHPLYAKQKQIIGTSMSNYGLEHFLHSHNKKLIRTQVGDKYVSDYMNKHDLLLGGEQSGHIILHDYLPTGDGIFTALRICQVAIQTGNWQLKSFKRFPQILINVPVKQKKELKKPALAAIIKNYQQKLTNGRLVVRYSGTEPLLRIMVEDKKIKNAQTIAHGLAQHLQKALSR